MRRRDGVVAIVAVLLLLGLWASTPSAEPAGQPTARGPRPGQSWVARRVVRTAPTPAPEAEEEATPGDRVPHTSLVVHLHEPGEASLVFPRRARLDPSAFWPLPGEAPFPEGESATALQALIAGGAAPGSDAVQDWLDTAWAEGLDPAEVAVQEPWRAVLALEVARRAAAADQQLAYEAALAAGEGPENGRITPDALVGPADHGVQRSLADDLVTAWPDHPASEYARLYQLHAARRSDAPEAARDLALDLLRHSDDALVVGQAVGLLGTLPRGAHLGPADLDTLARFASDFPELVDPLELPAFALDQAMAEGDGPRTRAWLERFEAALERECPPRAEELETSRCLIHRGNRDEVVALVGDRRPSEADGWRQAFEIAGYQCARAGHSLDPLPIRTTARWRAGSWSWEPWDQGPTPFAACVQGAAAEGPPPPEPALDVALSLVR